MVFGVEQPNVFIVFFSARSISPWASPTEEWENKGEKGAYFLVDKITLEGDQAKEWHIIADVNQSMIGIRSLTQAMGEGNIIDQVHKDIQKGTKKLIQLCAAADGLQLTNDKRTIMRHFSNTMFNIMRGGIFDANYQIEKADFLSYLQQANKAELKNLKINSINGMNCFHSSNWQSISVQFLLFQSNGWQQNICHSNLVAVMAIRVVPGTGFRSIPKTKMMGQKY